ncbi:hypothetical protein L596_030098 [Steinernema carpocapsae]|uniref:UDP-glucuronosyltransferase n=1 Tax=Steinernema carpocapsae TaxID=34508 RepID=A0A4V5ZX68_STECR|nr:hypothetical protein L596_030098 [Steinernema carpocapsae]
MKIGDDAFLNMQNLHPRKIETLLSTNWSLTIVDELFGTSMYGLAAYHHDRFKTPYIIHSTTTLIHVFAWNMGLGRSLIHRPSFWFPYNDNVRFDVTKFRQRLRAVTNALIVAGSMNFLTQNFDIKGIRQIGVEDFSFFNSWNQQAYNFHDDLMHFSFPAPISNEVKHVGRHCVNAKKLAPEFLDFVEDPASKGTIFIAFGTNVYWEFAPEHILDAFFDAVTELKDYRVVFSYNGLKPNRTIGSHVKLVSWSPQVEILSHKFTRLFITHGGLKSLREAICTAVPLIILPMAAEQTHNGAAVLEMGIAHVLSKFTISKKKLFGSIMEILDHIK